MPVVGLHLKVTEYERDYNDGSTLGNVIILTVVNVFYFLFKKTILFLIHEKRHATLDDDLRRSITNENVIYET